MNKLKTADRAAVVRCLVEGCSIRATVRMTGVAKNTVTKLLVDLGAACAQFQNRTLVNLTTRRVECDEIWAFVGMKEKNVPENRRAEFGVGDVWTWVAIDAETKLCISWLVGERDSECATLFMKDVALRIANRVQLSTDGHKPYLVAVEEAFAGAVDYAQVIKTYGNSPAVDHRRYSPAVCTGCEKVEVTGKPDPAFISTSYIERQNLTMRMGMRRFTRLTNGFSKKVENHMAAVSLHTAYANFCRVHMSLKATPAIKAGVADHVWSIEELVRLLDTEDPN